MKLQLKLLPFYILQKFDYALLDLIIDLFATAVEIINKFLYQ